MNTQKSVYNKLFSNQATELESHNVELSLESDMVGYSKKLAQANKDVLDMNKNINLLKTEYDNLNKIVSDKIATISRLQKSVDAAYATNSKAYTGVAKFALGLKTKAETASKELGLKPDVSPAYKDLVNNINNNMWLSIMNIANKDYFFKNVNTSKSSLLSNTAKIK